MKISVIVPIYKVEPYLDRCIQSIINQSYKELEIILVDDGSPDKCPGMCDAWAEKDRRIVVIHKKNEGLGFARNTGLAAATGEYISFIDSDDFIDVNTYQEVMTKIAGEYPDVCYFSHYRLKNDGSLLNAYDSYPTIAEQEEVRSQLIPLSFGQSLRKPYDSFAIGSSCLGVYHSEFLNANGIVFVSEKQYLCEDFIFTIEVCLNAKRVSFINAPVYYYCENANSLSLSYRKDRLEKSEILYRYMFSVIQKHNLSEDTVLRTKDLFLINVMACMKQEVMNKHSNYFSKIREIRAICQSCITTEVTRHYPFGQLPLKRMIFVLVLKSKVSVILYFLTRLRLMSR